MVPGRACSYPCNVFQREPADPERDYYLERKLVQSHPVWLALADQMSKRRETTLEIPDEQPGRK